MKDDEGDFSSNQVLFVCKALVNSEQDFEASSFGGV